MVSELDQSVKWYFMRHGQIPSNVLKIYSGRSEETLTDEGRRQVKEACGELKQIPIDAIFSSPLIRTRQTAEIVAGSIGDDVPIHIADCFNELQMGPWEGMAEAEVSNRYPDEWALWNKSPAELVLDGRETLAQLQDRLIDGMRNIEREYEYESILVTTHVAVIRVMLLKATNRDLNEYKTIKVDNARIFRFEKLP